MKKTKRMILIAAIPVCLIGTLSGCGLQRRAEVSTASGADERLSEQFGLTDDAQDPTERDKELGYGRWKSKPETKGTDAPTSPNRRGKSWSGSP
jgi:hypothetical protein